MGELKGRELCENHFEMSVKHKIKEIRDKIPGEYHIQYDC